MPEKPLGTNTLRSAGPFDLLTDEEIESQINDLQAERKRRSLLRASQSDAEEFNLKYLSRRDEVNMGEEYPVWQSPSSPADVYPKDYIVEHGGKVWKNTHPFNSWEPGTTNSQWIEVIPEPPTDPDTGEPGIVEWGVGQDVAVGDIRSYAGNKWEAKIAHVTHDGWPPGPDTYAVWLDLGPL
jgi:hypothetical protein